jgi:PAS domain S-box-containing protein
VPDQPTNRTHRPSLQRTIIARQSLVVLLSILVVGAVWLLSRYLAFRRESAELTDMLTASRKERLKNEVDRVVDFIAYQQAQTRQRLEAEIRQRVVEAHAIASNLYREHSGRLPEAELQKVIVDALRPIRFNAGRGYYFITALNGIEMLFADRPEMEGRDMRPVQGGRGEFVVQEMISLVREKGEGFTEYAWSKPGHPEPRHLKISFVKHFAPFDWLIGTGAYLEDVESDIQQETLARIERIRFADGGYVFAGTWEGVSLAGPAKGQNMLEVTDAAGIPVVRELIGLARSGGGYLSYVMPPIEGQQPSPKLSYVEAIYPWQWYVGAGVYLHEIDQLIARRRAELERTIAHSAVNIVLILAGAMVLAILLSRRTARRIQFSCDSLQEHFRRVSARIDPAPGMEVAFSEFEELSATVNRMAAERRHIEKERERLFTLSIDMLCVAGFDGFFKELNPAWEKTLGWSDEELLAVPWRDRVHPKDRCKTLAAGKELAAGRAVHDFENRFRCRDGSYRWLSWNSLPLVEERLIFAVVRDVTLRKRDEATRVLDEARLEALLRLHRMTEASLQEIASHAMEEAVRLTQSEIGYIAFMNPEETVLTMHAWSKGAMAQCRIAEKPIAYPVDTTGLWGEAVRRRQPVITNDFALPDPAKRGLPEGHVEIRRHMNVPIFEGDRIVIVAGVGNKGEPYDEADLRQLRLLMSGMWAVSQRKLAEQERQKLEMQLRQAQKMEAIGTLAGGIAHDFNNLLQAMQGYTELLLLDKTPRHPDFRALEQIGRAIRRGSELTRQVLTFSRKVEARLQPIDLNRLIESLGAMLSHSIPRMIAIVLDLAPGIWSIHADKAQMEQVIMNLVVNAKDAMPDGGQLRIATRNRCADPERDPSDFDLLSGRCVELTVADTGVGMDPETLKNIYDPFFTTKETGKGTGLGLAMVYGIVKAHGGRIACRSAPGEGTGFTICLPAGEQTASAAEAKPAMPPRGGSETILLVDDEEFIRDLGGRILSGFGYRVLTAETGERALELYRGGDAQIDLVILDVIMPGMGGLRCLEELLKLNPGLPVIVASGYSADGRVSQEAPHGSRGALRKPYQMVEMLRLIRAVMDAAGA